MSLTRKPPAFSPNTRHNSEQWTRKATEQIHNRRRILQGNLPSDYAEDVSIPRQQMERAARSATSIRGQTSRGGKRRKAGREKAHSDEFKSVKEKKGREGMSGAQEGEKKKL